MNRTIQTIRYLIYSLKWMVLVELLVSLGVVFLSDYAYIKTGGSDLGKSAVPGTVRLVAVVFSILVGVIYFRPNFRVALANGVSRKTFMWAYLPIAALVGMVFTIISQVIVGVHNFIWPNPDSFGALLNFKLAWLWSFVIQMVLYSLLIISGWFLSFVYYRSNTLMKWIVSLVISFVFFVPAIIPEYYGQTLSPALRDFVLWCVYRPERSPLILLGLTVILYELTFLLLHRAPLKD